MSLGFVHSREPASFPVNGNHPHLAGGWGRGGPPGSLGLWVGRLLPTGRPREAGRGTESKCCLAQPSPRSLRGPGGSHGSEQRRQVRGLRPAEVGTRDRRGLEADWGDAAPGRPNFSGTRGRPACSGCEPEPEWVLFVLSLRVRFPCAPGQDIWPERTALPRAVRSRVLTSVL